MIEQSISADLARIAFEDALPTRGVPSWKGKNVYEGDYWAATIRGFVHHESLFEREYAMAADFDPSIHALAWQPFVLKWRKGTRGQDNGDGPVVDVRPDKVEARVGTAFVGGLSRPAV